MAEVYTGYQSVLDASLGDYKDDGFHLVEKGDDLLFLYHLGKFVCSFSQLGATIPSIRAACREYLAGGMPC